MSHFTVLVIGPDIEKQLQPFHEFECTGKIDEYVQTIDVTDEARAEYEQSLDKLVKLPDGTLVGAFDDRFYREPTAEETAKIGLIAGTGSGHGMSWYSKDWGDGKGYSTRVLDHAGLQAVEVPTKDAQPFAEWAADYYGVSVITKPEELDLEKTHKFGWVAVTDNDVRVFDRTNPNKKWDWWVLGGRWTGYFPVKQDGAGKVGQPGGFGGRAEPGTADQLMWGDVDIERAREKDAKKARERFAEWRSCFEEHGKPESWDVIRARHSDGKNIEAARNEYHAQPAIRAAAKLRMWDDPVVKFGFDEEAYVERCRRASLVPFAILKDGQWYERGKMGWWGIVTDESDADEWQKRVADLFDSLSVDTLVSIVDCHI